MTIVATLPNGINKISPAPDNGYEPRRKLGSSFISIDVVRRGVSFVFLVHCKRRKRRTMDCQTGGKKLQPTTSDLSALQATVSRTNPRVMSNYESDSSKWSLASINSFCFPESAESDDERTTETQNTAGTGRHRADKEVEPCAQKSKGIQFPTMTEEQSHDTDYALNEPSSTRCPVDIEEIKGSVPTSPQVYRMAADRSRLSQLGFEYRYVSPPPVQDFKKSVEYYTEAASIGCPDAVVALAVAHLFGIGVNRSHRKARDLLRHGILQGSVDALEIRALCWMDGTFDGERSYASCLNLLTMGIARNSPSCLLWAGFCFEIGLGTDPDVDTAKQAYLAASDSPSLRSIVTSSFPGALTGKDPWMLLKITLFLLHSDCRVANRGHVMDCLKQAAALGLADAQVYLSICLIRGTWLAKDMRTARYWLRVASDRPSLHPVARRLLGLSR